MTILVTKLFAPPPSPKDIARPQLIGRLDAGLSRKLSLICAPAGFGKSTLLSAWIDACQYPSAWLSLDEGDGDPAQFLAYLIAALQTISETVGAGIPEMLRASPAPSAESVLTVLLNNLAATRSKLLLVLDDYHLVGSPQVDKAVAFLIEHLPLQMHLVIASREEPEIPLARLRVQGQITEVRQDDLRFGPEESAHFLNQKMGLALSPSNVAVLGARTEGWIAGLQLAAISLHGHADREGFIRSFNGSHHFVQDYLLEEVLRQQSESVQSFLMCTAVLDRLCAPLCDAVMQNHEGQQNLAYLAQANLFILPLDNERRWYRYHHLFAELLRHRLGAHRAAALHVRASEWYEANGMEIDAFRQAVAAADLPRASRLIEGKGMPLYFRGEMSPVIQWLQAQPKSVLDACPSLWIKFAWSLLLSGQFGQVGAKLSCAASAMSEAGADAGDQDLHGQIAALSAWLAVPKNDAASIHAQATLALELLHPANLPARTAAQCALGVAFLFRDDRRAASVAFAKVVSAGNSSGNVMFTIVASIALAGIHATNNQLHLAAAGYRDVIGMITDPGNTVGWQAHLGLARILYEWNELDAAESHALASGKLGQKQEHDDGSADALRVRVLLARGDNEGAAALLAQAVAVAKTKYVGTPWPELCTVQVLTMLRRGEVGAAARLATEQGPPMAQARVMLAQGDGEGALALATQHRHGMEEKKQPNEVLKAMVLQALALDLQGHADQAARLLAEVLLLAQPEGFVRLFIDCGAPMESLLSRVSADGVISIYVSRLLSIFALNSSMNRREFAENVSRSVAPPGETYSPRELEILQLIHQGLSNQGISERLFLSLSTVKWHNQNIFGKLQVQRRTEAVARALALNLIAQ